MSKTIKIDQLADELNRELTLYNEQITSEVKKSSRKRVNEMVKETMVQRFKQDTGDYRKAISSKTLENTPNSLSMLWYVKPPHYRLSHLLEHGHATRSGGRTIAYKFIGKAEDKAVKGFEKDVEEAIKNG